MRTSPPSYLALATVVLGLLSACPGPSPSPSPSPGGALVAGAIPGDAQDACPLSATTFAGWFESGSVSLDGVVKPADSLVNLAPNCGFYAWSEQMFLWLTSPAPRTYGGGGGRIFHSPVFFDVSPPDASGKRTFLPHKSGLVARIPLRTAKLGPHRLPAVVDRSGTLFEVQAAEPKAKLRVRDASGRLVEIVHAKLVEGRPVLLDANGRAIRPTYATAAREAASERAKGALIATKYTIDRVQILLDATLAVIDVEQGQAGDDGVLEAQSAANGSLVYYATTVNDVYAYFLTGVRKGAITTSPPNEFPTTASDLNSVIAFATANGRPSPPFPDPHALAVEIKSSWVRAAGLPNAGSYITMTATVPTYDQSSTTSWPQKGTETVKLALVGMHVVGSTLGHPELVWATFEHFGNTPVATYSYQSTSGQKQVVQNTAGNWLFAANGSAGPFNMMHMLFEGPPTNTITAESGFTISPSDTLRTMPFGMDGTAAGSNTEVISMNDHVLGMLVAGDIRANYVMTGATWTPFGSNPSFSNPGVGTNKLANTTMETYQQGSNCFSCHQSGSGPNPTTGVSHVFAGLAPLF